MSATDTPNFHRVSTSSRTAIIIALASVLTMVVAALPAVAHAATTVKVRTWSSGVMAGYGGDNAAKFGTWRGAKVQTGTDYLAEDSWASLENPSWAITEWGKSPTIRPTFSVPLFVQNGSFAEAASGVDNSHWVTLARNLVAGGLGNSVIRIGWEFNGTWYPWSVTSQTTADQYVAGWRQIVTAMRSVPGAHFSFDWCITTNSAGIDPAIAYPGDAYVDYIGEDVYDWNQRSNTGSETAAQRWSDIVSNGYGLSWQAGFGAAHQKPLSFPEWGVAMNILAPSSAGNDEPAFIQNMFTWFSTHNTAYENYFDIDTNYGTFYGLNTTAHLFPKSAAMYKSLFSQSTYAARSQ